MGAAGLDDCDTPACGYSRQMSPAAPYWVLVDTETRGQPHPVLKFPDIEEAETYHRLAFDADPRYEIREVRERETDEPEPRPP
jgi:hypothetical protein